MKDPAAETRWNLSANAGTSALAVTVLAVVCGLSAAGDAGAQGRRGAVHPKEPRIAPLAASESQLNVVKTIANHPKLAAAWQPLGGYILRESTLPDRHRELLILRTAWLCQAEYEWGHHARLARTAGITDAEILRITKGPEALGWSSFDRSLLRAADQLHTDSAIFEYTWGSLKARYNDQQMMDVVFTVGEYQMVAMAINAFGVQREEGIEGFPGSTP